MVGPGIQLNLNLTQKPVQRKPESKSIKSIFNFINKGEHYNCLTRPSRQTELLESISRKIKAGQRDDIKIEEIAMLYALKDLVNEERKKEEAGDRSYMFRDNRYFEGMHYPYDKVKYFEKLGKIEERR